MRTSLTGLAVALPLVLAPDPDRPAQALPFGAGAAHCLALALYFEARTEGVEGMEAVASVVRNRVRHPEFPNDVCGVVTGGEQAGPRCHGTQGHGTVRGGRGHDVGRRAVVAPHRDATDVLPPARLRVARHAGAPDPAQ